MLMFFCPVQITSGLDDHGKFQAPVVQRVDNAIHWINHYPVDKC